MNESPQLPVEGRSPLKNYLLFSQGRRHLNRFFHLYPEPFQIALTLPLFFRIAFFCKFQMATLTPPHFSGTLFCFAIPDRQHTPHPHLEHTYNFILQSQFLFWSLSFRPPHSDSDVIICFVFLELIMLNLQTPQILKYCFLRKKFQTISIQKWKIYFNQIN